MFKQASRPKVNRTGSLPAPVGGFNTSSLVTAMSAKYAVILENFLAAPDGLIMRDGYASHVTGLAAQADRLHIYSNVNGQDYMFATTISGIYQVTNPGAVGATVMALTNGLTITTSISTGAGNYMLLVNGTDTLKQYDGTTWTSVALFGATSTVIYSYIETYRQRIFLAKKNSLEIEYLAANSIAGAATNYPLGAVFRKGGYIVALGTWTIDGGVGPEDHLAIVTNTGEVAIFAGSDPATWAFRGTYNAGRPMGSTPVYKYGGDLLIITETGIIPLSSLLQNASVDKVATVSSNIRPTLVEAARLAPTGQGWQIISDPIKPFLLINLPLETRKQAVMQSQTQGWSLYTGWNALYFARMGTNLYFSTPLGNSYTIFKVTGHSDAGANITSTMLQAYNKLGYANSKKIEQVKHYFRSTGPFAYTLGVSNDFIGAKDASSILLAGGGAAIWGTSLFGVGVWSDTVQAIADWQTVADEYAVWKAHYLQVVSNSAELSYVGNDYLYAPGANF